MYMWIEIAFFQALLKKLIALPIKQVKDKPEILFINSKENHFFFLFSFGIKTKDVLSCYHLFPKISLFLILFLIAFETFLCKL